MRRARIVVASFLPLVLASGCFAPDAPPFQGATLAVGTTEGDTLDTGPTVTGDPDSGESTVDPDGTSTGSDLTTDTADDSSSSSGAPPGACGDGEIAPGTEGCDDANAEAGDGCSDTCEEEPGFQCVGRPSVCTSTCGDGIATPDEGCDDGNTSEGDGCTACAVDPGFECMGTMPSVCTGACGDGVVQAAEGCDDGGVANGDGCAADCSVELFYRCNGAGAGSCAPIRIGYIPADSDDAAFRMAIAAITGGLVTYTDASSTSPTLMQLQASYDCVFTHANYSYLDSPGFGNALAGFVDGGGTVVLGIAADYTPPTGLSTSMIMTDAYSPVSTASNVAVDNTSYAGDGTTPIHDGVVSYTAPIYDTAVVLQGAGMQDATYVNGTIAVAYRPDFKVVYLNGTGNVSFGPTGDWPRLLANACAVGFVQ